MLANPYSAFNLIELDLTANCNLPVRLKEASRAFLAIASSPLVLTLCHFSCLLFNLHFEPWFYFTTQSPPYLWGTLAFKLFPFANILLDSIIEQLPSFTLMNTFDSSYSLAIALLHFNYWCSLVLLFVYILIGSKLIREQTKSLINEVSFCF